MTKRNFEIALLDPSFLERLLEQIKVARTAESPIGADRGPSFGHAQAPSASSPHKDEKRKGRRQTAIFQRKRYRYADLFRSLHKKSDDAASMLHAAIVHYKEKPSRKAADQVEMAINRIASVDGDRSKEMTKAVDEAKTLLAQRIDDANDGGFQGDNVSATLFADSDFHGASLFGNLAQGGTYTGWDNLKSVHFNDKISSVTLQCSPDEVGGSVFLFQNADYDGRYLQVSASGGQTSSMSYVGSSMNDRASSILIYRRFQGELTFLLSDFITADEVDPLIRAQPNLSPRGDPILTWDPYPDGHDGHPNAPYAIFVYIRLPVTVAPHPWPWNYDAEIRFWVSLFVDEDGTLGASLDFYGAWVESGLQADKIYNQMMGSNGIVTAIPDVENLLQSAVDLANTGAPFQQVFLLPGRNAASGQTTDDVTIAVVPGLPPPPVPIQ